MAYVVGILIVVVIILVTYLVLIQGQMRNMSRQLKKRLSEHTRQPVSLELINPDLNELVVNMNKCLQAEEKLRLKGIQEEKKFKEMIADISHDLRTPLTAIKGYQQLIDKGELTIDQRKKLLIARKYSEELGQLIEHFFEYSYLLNAEPELNISRFNLTNLVTECIVASITSLEEKNIAVNLEENPPIFVFADKEMVTRIIQNLIRNCIQHAYGDIKVQLFADKKAIISFQNQVKNSVDIDVNKIFDRFYTGDKARSHSSGLGLSIVKLLAEQMGGSANVYINGDMLDIRVGLSLNDETARG